MRVSEFDRIVVAEMIRPENTTQYAAAGVIGSDAPNKLFVFPNAGRSPSATGYIRSIRLLTTQTTCQAVCTLWLYNDIPTVQTDGVELKNLWSERAMCLGHFTLPALACPGDSDYALAETWFDQYNIYSCSAKTANLYGQLTTGTVFSPDSGQAFRLELGLHQNEYE